MPVILTRRDTTGGVVIASTVLNDSAIPGASVKDALEFLDSDKVSYNFENNTISGTGDIHAGSYFGDGSNLTGITASGVTVDQFIFNEPPSTVSGTIIFSLTQSPVANTVQLHINGLLQEPGIGNDYTISGQIITFTQDLAIDDILLAHYITS